MTLQGTVTSLVIPVLDEEDYIAACLDHVLPQIDELSEVIVVDNGSMDDTVQIVKEYAAREPKIRLVHEPRKGLFFSRNTGFREATSDIIGRIDADTRIGAGWVSAVKQTFRDADSDLNLGGITGLSAPYDSPFTRSKKWLVDALVRAKVLGNGMKIDNMHGANMAVRLEAWDAVQDKLTSRSDVHEDIDFALCLIEAGYSIVQPTEMWADISPRRALTPPLQYTSFVKAGITSFEIHGRSNWSLRWLVAPVTWLSHAVFWFPYRAYDPVRRSFSPRRLLTERTFRPAALSEAPPGS
ncbi:glycosyltransferase [Rhodococcus sp. BP-149]|jgi:glycosyltransferase involved in cell wall biosynthesis|uniref:glycosyltransferase n=1 Tax=unclassified Rhodococcus (in: high G+C Gram-positive bacteria) TaxID=192944 RepID=UPI000690727A|nr:MULTISPECIES: glycosyltransferase [unclassified Rhodococcus (in: high G+C Gram-positive bacteria)]MBY6685114.1 glycosyltransferase [Rhodococcus sp. BP-288]MBY6692402.1 glycosyltransferase [Rhodococcus sp. BP-188]MBY6698300.1 glycosyltransferase [Rhodococcus sp. BP-285]MBY6700979.1 glycosyltransferase [Rhodococcus sp. BP-283]MBY6711980.1 glycosyltransferase [Rhodococcus sp. BP-160]